MSNPSGVPDGATNFTGLDFHCGANNASVVITTKLYVDNESGGEAVVNIYTVLDGTLIDAIPAIYHAGGSRQQHDSDWYGLGQGSHHVDMWLYCASANVSHVWSRLRADVDKNSTG